MLSGDSGSGLIDQASFTRGRPKLVGVDHLAGFGHDREPNSTVALRVDEHAAFLRAGAAEAAALCGYPLPRRAGDTPDLGEEETAGEDGLEEAAASCACARARRGSPALLGLIAGALLLAAALRRDRPSRGV